MGLHNLRQNIKRIVFEHVARIMFTEEELAIIRKVRKTPFQNSFHDDKKLVFCPSKAPRVRSWSGHRFTLPITRASMRWLERWDKIDPEIPKEIRDRVPFISSEWAVPHVIETPEDEYEAEILLLEEEYVQEYIERVEDELDTQDGEDQPETVKEEEELEAFEEEEEPETLEEAAEEEETEILEEEEEPEYSDGEEYEVVSLDGEEESNIPEVIYINEYHNF